MVVYIGGILWWTNQGMLAACDRHCIPLWQQHRYYDSHHNLSQPVPVRKCLLIYVPTCLLPLRSLTAGQPPAALEDHWQQDCHC